MSEPTYTVKEIIELQFRALGKDIQEIKQTLQKQNENAEARFNRIEKDIDDLRIESTRHKTIWGIGATIGASVVAVFSGRLFS